MVLNHASRMCILVPIPLPLMFNQNDKMRHRHKVRLPSFGCEVVPFLQDRFDVLIRTLSFADGSEVG